MNEIEKQLEIARKSLLDLTLRNRLINFKPTKKSTIQIVDEKPAEVFNLLVINENTMSFKPGKDHESENQSETAKESEPRKRKTPIKHSSDNHQDNSHDLKKYTDKYLQTALKEDSLNGKLYYINQQANSILEEQGYNILYLALCFLEWSEVGFSENLIKSPLILVPVEIERSIGQSNYKLRWSGDEIITNISLLEKLKEQNILLPEFDVPDDKLGFIAYIDNCSDLIINREGWRVIEDIYLGFFSFTKFVMYKDLDPSAWPRGKSPADNQIIKAIFGPSETESANYEFTDKDIDTKLKTVDLYNIMDADPSQIIAIQYVNNGKNLVVEGPPGTGKSQTIANMIADLLAANKKVLFVSEKMAALEVVKKRLENAGIGDFCIELHSKKTNKKDFLKEIELSIPKSQDSFHATQDMYVYERYDELRDLLNSYANALSTPAENCRFSPFELYSIREQQIKTCQKHKIALYRLAVPSSVTISDRSIKDSENLLRELSYRIAAVNPINKNIWYFCNVGNITISDERDIDVLIDVVLRSIKEIKLRTEELSQLSGAETPHCFSQLSTTLAAARIVSEYQISDRNVLLNREWNDVSPHAKNIITVLKAYYELKQIVTPIFKPEAFKENISKILSDYLKYSQNSWRIFYVGYYRLLKQINGLYRSKVPVDHKTICISLRQMEHFLLRKQYIFQNDKIGASLFGSLWRGEQSDPELLESFSEWIVNFRKQILTHKLSDRAIDLIQAGIEKQKLTDLISTITKLVEFYNLDLSELVNKLKVDITKYYNKSLLNISFDELVSLLSNWKKSINNLAAWSQYISVRNQCKGNLAESFISIIELGKLQKDGVIPQFWYTISDTLLMRIFQERNVLDQFNASVHENHIHEFIKEDINIINLNRKRLKAKLNSRKPSMYSGVSRNSQAGMLLQEINKKKRHLPIRKLLSSAGNLIQSFKPCFMMSPLSIAQFLDPNYVKFDVVIFDEASQVKPADALGAFLRANQAVILGDTQQLPPTSFFENILDDDDDDDENYSDYITDLESILHLCRTSFVTKRLNWHYRSRHDSLIAVSNEVFYDNSLKIYPSPSRLSPDLGMHFRHLPDTVYDRGKSRTNKEEARRIVMDVIKHYETNPNKSAGIGAFSISQQQAIIDELDIQLRNRPELVKFFTSNQFEYCFVKNLETIQGDERDFIFVSVGYGFDVNRTLNLNFGPILSNGGERRLNVLMTRAREKCTIYSNFKGDDIHADHNSSRGLRCFKQFLEFAETRKLKETSHTNEESESYFEESVFNFLISVGLKPRKQVGCASYRIDMAIPHPQKMGEYILGIECDGARYHSSTVARERDRLRQQILESLGWKLYRIWSTDWFRNRKDAQIKLINKIKAVWNGSDCTSSPQLPDIDTAQKQSLPNHPAAAKNNASLSVSSIIPKYIKCKRLKLKPFVDHQTMNVIELADIVNQIVEIEGPIHRKMIIYRIKELLHIERIGKNIINRIDYGINYAIQKKDITQKGDFFKKTGLRRVNARMRSSDDNINLDFICDDEIKEAILLVLQHQFSTPQDELIIQAARFLGIGALHEHPRERIKKIISDMKKANILSKDNNNMLVAGKKQIPQN